MKWNFDDLESKLNKVSEDLKHCDKDLKKRLKIFIIKMKQIVQNI